MVLSKFTIFICSLLLSNSVSIRDHCGKATPLSEYLPAAIKHAENRIQDAINPAGSTVGSLQAALSGTCPNYAYAWPRDQALVYSTVMDAYEVEAAGPLRHKHEQNLKDFATHTHTIYDLNDNPLQYANNGRPWSFADAKYEMNGTLYKGEWGTPQNDGPALRAMVLIRFAKRYNELHGENNDYVKNNLYSKSMAVGVKNPIKRDLEYLYQFWDIDNFEPWEEIKGKHFYNRIMARRAFKMAAEFTRSIDPEASAKWSAEVSKVERAISSHWDEHLKVIKPTNNPRRYDDIQTVMATAHSYAHYDDYYGATNDRVLANAFYTLEAFQEYWHINKLNWDNKPELGVALGRYLGDIYNGFCDLPTDICPIPCNGQPWFLATNAMGELLFRAIKIYKDAGKITVNKYNEKLLMFFGGRQTIESTERPFTLTSDSDGFKHILTSLIHGADSFLKRTQRHTDGNYRLDEQYNSVTGKQMSAGDLTWSYASLVTANNARKALDPEKTIASFTPVDMVELEVIVTKVPKKISGVIFSGSIAQLGNGNYCKGIRAAWRRDVGYAAEWSAFVKVPKNSVFKIKVAIQQKWNVCDKNIQEEAGDGSEIVTAEYNPLNAVYKVWN